MLETIQLLLTSHHPWSAFFNFIIGLIFGALISTYLTFNAQKPKLILSGGGGGGNQQEQSWNLTVLNRPTFFGLSFAGETAIDVNAWLRLREKDSNQYALYWSGERLEFSATIEPGQQKNLQLFTWSRGERGYFVVDQTGERVARFEDRELKFLLGLNDRLGRRTEFPITVKFDDSHLKNIPQLDIVVPFSFSTRLHFIKRGLRQIVWAFRIRR